MAKHKRSEVEQPEMTEDKVDLEKPVEGEVKALAVVPDGGISRHEILEKMDIDAKLAELESMKDEDLEEYETDFWKPTTPGEFIVGIFAGSEPHPEEEYLTHEFAVRDRLTGKPYVKRMTGGKGLDKLLARGNIGQGLKLTFVGFKPSKFPQPMREFKVLWEKTSKSA